MFSNKKCDREVVIKWLSGQVQELHDRLWVLENPRKYNIGDKLKLKNIKPLPDFMGTKACPVIDLPILMVTGFEKKYSAWFYTLVDIETGTSYRLFEELNYREPRFAHLGDYEKVEA